MRYILTLAISLLSFASYAQTNSKYEEAILNRDPMGLRMHMARTLVISDEIRLQGIKGDALFMFKVDTTGFIDSIRMMYTTHELIAAQALDALQRTDGRWTAARRNGKYQSAWMYVPVKIDASKNGNGLTDIAPVADSFYKAGLNTLQKGKHQGAMHLFNAAYNLNPANAQPLYDLAQTYFKTRDKDIACFYLEKISTMIRGASAELKEMAAADMAKNCK
ncbi:MAG: tetratricopeptide repeat protein [Sphingobacteriales bacterium]|nr:MAG: tetratricopeptide repeat protein [Sphingobacteriales bacterium]